jgi:hypothetical protein
MNGADKKQLAQRMEKNIGKLLEEMTAVLKEHGMHGVSVVGFTAGTPSPFIASANAAPRPVECKVLPDGTIICEPAE